ncbi:hypothetical protein, partial [Lactococcus lactis]
MNNKKCPNCGYELDSWNDCVSVNNILECPECEEHFELKAVRLNKPQLTIPKSIADELEKYDFELTSKGLMYKNMGGTLVEFSRVTYDEIPQLIVQTIAGNYRIVFAYL